MATGIIKNNSILFPDFSNVIATASNSSGNKSYTATKKCWVYIVGYTASDSSPMNISIKINNKYVATQYTSIRYLSVNTFLPLHAGDTITVESDGIQNDFFSNYTVYGMK